MQLAEDVWARIFVPLQNGTTVMSGNRVKINAGAWLYESDPKDEP